MFSRRRGPHVRPLARISLLLSALIVSCNARCDILPLGQPRGALLTRWLDVFRVAAQWCCVPRSHEEESC